MTDDKHYHRKSALDFLFKGWMLHRNSQSDINVWRPWYSLPLYLICNFLMNCFILFTTVKSIHSWLCLFFNGLLAQKTPQTRWNLFLAHLSCKLKWAFLIAFRPASVCPSVCPSVCKLFLFSTSSQILSKFQPILALGILWWREFNFVQMKGHTLFQGEIITK